MDPVDDALQLTADYAAQFLSTLDERPIRADASVEELREALGGPLPETGREPTQVIAELIAGAEPGVVAMPSGRYFGFVIGGALPAALAADWLTSTWDQNAGLVAAGPSAAVVEEVALAWLRELLGLPDGVSAGFVTGCQLAHVTALAAARHHVLDAAGWDLARDGLQGAPRLRVLVGEERHVTVDRALRFLGIGSAQIEPLAVDGQGRMRSEALRDALRAGTGPTIVCAQSGNVNTGAFDPLEEIADAIEGSGAWLHVDGAFGLWAAASPRFRHLVAGVGAGGLLGHGRPQVAERALRLRDRLLRPSRLAPRGDVRPRELPRAGRPGRRTRPGGLEPRVLAPRARLSDLRSDPLARPGRDRRDGRALLRPRCAASASCSARSPGWRS